MAERDDSPVLTERDAASLMSAAELREWFNAGRYLVPHGVEAVAAHRAFDEFSARIRPEYPAREWLSSHLRLRPEHELQRVALQAAIDTAETEDLRAALRELARRAELMSNAPRRRRAKGDVAGQKRRWKARRRSRRSRRSRTACLRREPGPLPHLR